MCQSLGTLKGVNFPYGTNENFISFRCPNTWHITAVKEHTDAPICLKTDGGMANSPDPDQIMHSLILVCTASLMPLSQQLVYAYCATLTF